MKKKIDLPAYKDFKNSMDSMLKVFESSDEDEYIDFLSVLNLHGDYLYQYDRFMLYSRAHSDDCIWLYKFWNTLILIRWQKEYATIQWGSLEYMESIIKGEIHGQSLESSRFLRSDGR